MKKNSLVKIAFITCKPMMSNDDSLRVAFIYNAAIDSNGCMCFVDEKLRLKGYVPYEFVELPPMTHSAARALAWTDGALYGANILLDNESDFIVGNMSLQELVG